MNSAPVERFTHEAMATPWQLHIAGADPVIAQQAAREAFALTDQLEARLSRFREGSDPCVLAHLQPGQPWFVSAATYDCLELAKAVHAETGGAFDVTLTPFYDARRCHPSARHGLDLVRLHPERRQVSLDATPLFLDFGGIGKGYALDEMAGVLAAWDVRNALLVAGFSTMLALGRAPGADGWPVGAGAPDEPPAVLSNGALSASGFEARGWHILDPRTLQPVVTGRRRSWVFAESAALADALSTAILVMSETEIAQFSQRHPEITIRLA